MFTILDRQLIFNFVKAYVFSLISLMGLYIVIDLFMNLEDFAAGHPQLDELVSYIGKFYGYKAFQIFDLLCESMILMSAMFTVAWMQRSNELLPLLSAGVSARRAVQPVLVCAFATMGLASLNQELGLPSIDVFMLENRRNPEGTAEVDVQGCYDLNSVHITGRSAVRKELLIKEFVVVIPANLGNSNITTLQAKEAVYLPPKPDDKGSGGWLLKETTPGDLPGWTNVELLKPLGNKSYFLKSAVDLDMVIRVKNWFAFLPTFRLLKELNRPGNPQQINLAVLFHTRLTRPIVGVILVLMGLSIILRDQNRNVFISTGLCLVLCVVFFSTIFACQALGKDDIVSPALAAWMPVILFGPSSLVMFDSVHT